MNIQLRMMAICIIGFAVACTVQPPTTLPAISPATPTVTALVTKRSPAATRSATVTSRPTQTPTPSSTPTPTAPTLPTLPSVSANARFITPAPESLLNLIELNNSRYSYAQNNYDGSDLVIKQILNDTPHLNSLLNYEIRRNYPDGFPNTSVIWQNNPFKNIEWWPVYPSAYLTLLSDAVFTKLNQEQISLANQTVLKNKDYKIRVFPIEIDRDPEPEWLLLIEWETLGDISWLTLDSPANAPYVKLDSQLPRVLRWSEGEDDIEVLQDFTGDGLTDLIFRDYGYFFGTDFGTFYIAQGDPTGFISIGAVDQRIPGYLSEGLIYEVRNLGAGLQPSLVISDPHQINWDCNWETVTVYRWPNGNQRSQITQETLPNTPNCYLAQAVSLTNPPKNQTAIQWLEQAARGFDKNDPVQLAKLAFARYRLAILYALERNEVQARQNFQWVIDNSPQSPAFVQNQLSPLLEAKPLNPLALCEMMANATPEQLPQVWLDYANATAAFNAYPYSPELYPPVICEPREILKQQLQSVKFNAQTSPAEALNRAGFSVVSTVPYPIPDQPHPGWLALVGEERPYVVGYLPTLDGWRWEVMYQFSIAKGRTQVVNEDFTGDGYPELAFIQPLVKNFTCQAAEQEYELYLTTATQLGFVSVGRNACNPKNQTPNFPAIFADADEDGVVDWVTEQMERYGTKLTAAPPRSGPATWLTPEEIQSLFIPKPTQNATPVDYLTLIYEQNAPAAARAELLTEREQLTLRDDEELHRWQYLTLLIGLSYAKEGQPDKALETFIAVINTQPQTIWGNFAAMYVDD